MGFGFDRDHEYDVCLPIEDTIMKLRFSPTSPYVRKVMVSAIELELNGQIERLITDPWNPDSDLPTHNPLGKVPALILDDGRVLYDSPVICEYLDQLGGEPRLFPSGGDARWRALRLQALADGMLDASVSRLLEGRREDAERSESWLSRQRVATGRVLDYLETQVVTWGDGNTIGQISVACALGYLDFRFDTDHWLQGRDRLAAWYADFAQRNSMQQTVPVAPSA